jgi:Ca2+-binding RTX toxin-like protein
MATATELAIATIDSGVDATDLAQTIFGAGIQVISATYSGDPNSAGIYSGADTTIPGITGSDGGVILSTGNVADFTNSSGTSDTNTSDGTGTGTAGVDGDPLLNDVSGYQTFDGAILEADFIPEGDMLTMQFVFSSEEYLEYVNLGVNDAFGVWVNGVFAPVSVSLQRETIDTVNGSTNQNLYIDNPATLDTFNTEMDGFTVVLSVKAPVVAGAVNTIRIGIADGGDDVYDSNVMIMANSVQTYALAIEDQIQISAGTTRTFDILANDRDLSDQGLTITQINGVDITVGETVTLPTGQDVTLNADGTITVTSLTEGSDVFTYEVTDTSGNTDIGLVTLTTTTAPAQDGIVEGTAGDDVIDATYMGDPDGDLIDAGDALGVGGTTGDGDYIIAGAGNDSIVGGSGDDVIYAGADDDTVFGGAGDDFVSLGAGNDSFGTYNADSAGNDTVYGNAGNDFIITGAADDVIYGGEGSDTLSGGIGSDTLYGGAGQDNFNITEDHEYDSIVGGQDHDIIWFGNYLVDSGVNVTFTGDLSGTYAYDLALATGDFIEVEGITATDFNDTIDASVSTVAVHIRAELGDDQIFGGTVADTLDGGAGDDLIMGGAGDDTLIGGEGADTLDGGEGNDTIVDSGGPNDIYGGLGDDTILSGADNDYIAGDEGDDSLSGGDGADYMDGGTGADTIYGGTGGDTIYGGSETIEPLDPSLAAFTQITADYQTILGTMGNPDFSVTSTSGDGSLTFADYGPITNGFFIGEADGEEVHTHSFDTEVSGAQIILNGTNIGETLTITLDGMIFDLNDAIAFGWATFDDPTGTYVIEPSGRIGGTSNDAMVLEATTATLTINMAFMTLQIENNGGVGGSVYSLSVNTNPSLVSIPDQADFIDAGDGADFIDAAQGDDTVLGGDGDDTIYGQEGDDSLTGDAGFDLIYAGDGNDTIDGGLDNDVVFGGDGNDFITDLGGHEYIDAGYGDDTVDGGTGDDVLHGSEGFDLLYAGEGDDLVMGGFDADTLFGGSGNDLLMGHGNIVNLIQNGSFEDTTGMTPTSWGFIGSDGTAPGGWFTGPGGVIDIHNSGVGGPTDGTNWLDTEGVPGVTTISQTIAGVIEGVPYRLEFDAIDGPTDDNGLNVYWNGDLIGTVDPETFFPTGYVFDVIGGSGDGSNTLTFEVTGPVDGTGVQIDNVAFWGASSLVEDAVGDSISGGDDADTIYGGGNDTVDGGEGGVDADVLIVRDVDAIVYGGGNDEAGTITFLDGSLLSFTNIETIYADGALITPPIRPVDGTVGADVIGAGYIDAQGDAIDGIDGPNDSVLGEGGDDWIDAGAGNDTVFGGDGSDTLLGGTGANILDGGTGDDVFVTGAGADTFIGGGGQDNIDASASAAGVNIDLMSGAMSGGDVANDAIGYGIDGVIGSSFDDTLLGFDDFDPSYTNQLFGGDGADFIDGRGGDDLLDGGSGADTVYGSGGNDLIDGGLGADALYGGDDADTITGGGGDTVEGGEGGDDNDSLIVNGVDRIQWNGPNSESGTVHFTDGSTLVFSEIENVVADGVVVLAPDGIVEGTSSADLIDAFYTGDPQGDSIDAGDALFPLAGPDDDVVLAGDGDDTVYSGAGNDSVDAGLGADTVDGGDGNDTIDGGQGTDLLYGGDGADSLLGGTEADTLFGGAGNDSLDGGMGNDLIHGGADDDLIIGGGGSDEMYGEEGNDTIAGSDGADSIYGGVGNDSITGIGGNDLVAGYLGDDTIYAGSGSDTLDGAEGNDLLFGGLDDDFLLGGDDQDTLQGDEGNDTLWAGEGDDRLIGSAGDDSMSGEGGDDVFVLYDDSGLDTIIGGESSETLGDTLDASAMNAGAVLDLSAGDPGNPEQGTLTQIGAPGHIASFVEIENILLGSGNDSVIGSSGADVVSTGAGADTVDGGAGDDFFNIGLADGMADLIRLADGDGADTVQGFEGPIDNGDGTFISQDMLDVSGLVDGSGNPVDTADVVVSDDGLGNAVLIFPNLESVTLIGVAAASLASPAALAAIGIPLSLADGIVDGTSSNDIMGVGYTDLQGDQIDGADGLADTIYGYGGDDSITAGDGADLIDAGAGDDTVYGGLDADTINGMSGNDHLYGDEGADNLFGWEDDDTLYGGAGNDIVDGDAGNDVLYGGDGSDTVVGDDGADILDGGDGADELYGGTQDDTLTGGAGADLMFGGDDADLFFGGIGDVIYGGNGGNDNDTLNLSSYGRAGVNVIYGGGTDENGTVEFLDTGGAVIGSLTFTDIERVIPCFTPGCQILTIFGEVAVENLALGDLVMTRDHGYQPVRWIGRRDLGEDDLCQNPAFNPVRIPKGAFGHDMPERDLLVSPQHRILMHGPKAEILFGEHEVLISATHLVGMEGISRTFPRSVTYIHIMFDEHEIIRSDGAWSESFQPGPQTIGSMQTAQRAELMALFPQLAESLENYSAARRSLKSHEARAFLGA